MVRRTDITGRGGMAAALLSLASLAAGGCSHFENDPRFHEKSAERIKRIDRYVDSFHDREAEGNKRIDHTLAIVDTARERHERNLERTCNTIDQKIQRRHEEWPERFDAAGERIDEGLQGDAESIDRTIPRMFY